jgi:hypothetical protein
VRSRGKCTRSNPLKVHRGVDFCEVRSFEVNRNRPSSEDRWQQIRKFEDSDLGRFARAEELENNNPSHPSRRDTWREINISLTRNSESQR